MPEIRSNFSGDKVVAKRIGVKHGTLYGHRGAIPYRSLVLMESTPAAGRVRAGHVIHHIGNNTITQTYLVSTKKSQFSLQIVVEK